MFYGKDKENCNSTQNIFTAYLLTALQRRKNQYIAAQYRQDSKIVPLEGHDDLTIPDGNDLLSDLPFMEQIENPLLHHGLNLLDKKSQFVVMARIIDTLSYEEIALQLGMTYKGVTSLYYRAILKLRSSLRGE